MREASKKAGRKKRTGEVRTIKPADAVRKLYSVAQVRDVSAFISRARPDIEGDLRVQILYQGEVVEENLATGTAPITPVSWSPGRPF